MRVEDTDSEKQSSPYEKTRPCGKTMVAQSKMTTDGKGIGEFVTRRVAVEARKTDSCTAFCSGIEKEDEGESAAAGGCHFKQKGRKDTQKPRGGEEKNVSAKNYFVHQPRPVRGRAPGYLETKKI